MKVLSDPDLDNVLSFHLYFVREERQCPIHHGLKYEETTKEYPSLRTFLQNSHKSVTMFCVEHCLDGSFSIT
jgi:hypothetical protein